jgi:hypothetical protein
MDANEGRSRDMIVAAARKALDDLTAMDSIEYAPMIQDLEQLIARLLTDDVQLPPTRRAD